MERRWSEATTQEFVRMYLKRDCLWNTSDPMYKDKLVREAQYLAMAEEFQDFTGHTITTDDVKRKIKNLRTTYSQQLQKITSRSRDPTRLYRPSLVWFEEMDACLKQLTVKPIRLSNQGDSETELAQQSETEELDSKVWVAANEEMETEAREDVRPDPLVARRPPAASPPPAALRKRSSAFHNIKVKKRKLKRERASPGYHSSSDMERAEEPRRAALEDEFDIYGKYIASQMRRMHLQKALRLQMEINRLVSSARLSEAGAALDTD